MPLHSITPRLSLTESDKEIIVEAEVAGYPEESLTLEFLDPSTLKLSGSLETNKSLPYASANPTQGKLGATSSDSNRQAETAHTAKVNQSGGAEQRDEGLHNVSETTSQTHASKAQTEGQIRRQFSRRVELPVPVDPGVVKASLKLGILSIVMPKTYFPADSQAGRNIGRRFIVLTT